MEIISGKVKAISMSRKRGVKKKNVPRAEIITDFGISGDAHAGKGQRQVSLLDENSIIAARSKGLNVSPGDFAENIIVSGLDFSTLRIKDRLILNESVILEITQIGKVCDTGCIIFRELGECAMADKGVFTKVIDGGNISVGDRVELRKN